MAEKNPRVSRDEMNLAEFPLTVLSTRSNPKIKTLEFKDSITGKNGDIVSREWIITGADKFGLPTSSDDEVLLGLLKLTVDDGMRQRKVYFTRYELLKILRWSTEGRSYSRLQKALDRLSGVRIKATNAFYDNDTKTHRTKNFGLIDAYEITSSRDGDHNSSFFQWSEVLFKSFQVGFIKKLDLDFYLSLKSAVSKRLYRFLDKHFWYKSTVSTNVFMLAHEKIGISRNYKYASSLRQQLDPALDELQSSGYVDSYSYSGRGRNCVVTIYAVSSRSARKEKRQVSFHQEERQNPLVTKTVGALIERGLNEKQALNLIVGKSEEVLTRIQEIICYYDSLCSKRSKLVSKSPVGFLYRAVEDPIKFILPNETGEHTLLPKTSQPLVARENRKVHSAPAPSKRSSEAAYLVDRRQRIDAAIANLPKAELSGLYQDVERALEKLRPLISANRFKEAVKHGVEEKIAKKISLLEYRDWVASL